MSGADFSGCAVTYDIRNDDLVLWIPYTDPRMVLWYGKTPTLKECQAASDVDEVRYISALPEFLCSALTPGSTLYILHPGQGPALENSGKVVRIDSTSLAPAIERARVIKTGYEIAMIRRANAVSVSSLPLYLSALLLNPPRRAPRTRQPLPASRNSPTSASSTPSIAASASPKAPSTKHTRPLWPRARPPARCITTTTTSP